MKRIAGILALFVLANCGPTEPQQPSSPGGGGLPPLGGGQVAVGGGQVAVGGGQVAVGGGQVAVGGGQVAVGGGHVTGGGFGGSPGGGFAGGTAGGRPGGGATGGGATAGGGGGLAGGLAGGAVGGGRPGGGATGGGATAGGGGGHAGGSAGGAVGGGRPAGGTAGGFPVGGGSSGGRGGGGASGGPVAGGSAGGSVECNTGQHLCGGRCVLNSSPDNCGSSCTPCSPPSNADANCDGRSCGFTCRVGYNRCQGASGCFDMRDVRTCGSTCRFCPTPANSQATCDGTSCGFVCAPGYHACGTACLPNASANSCGSSCAPCPAPANGVATCNGGSCGFACNTGHHACGGQCLANTDVLSCGTSCSPCPGILNGLPSCDGASCGVVCNTGFRYRSGSCVPHPSVPCVGIQVPGDQPTIAAALTQAAGLGTICVAPGTYADNLFVSSMATTSPGLQIIGTEQGKVIVTGHVTLYEGGSFSTGASTTFVTMKNLVFQGDIGLHRIYTTRPADYAIDGSQFMGDLSLYVNTRDRSRFSFLIQNSYFRSSLVDVDQTQGSGSLRIVNSTFRGATFHVRESDANFGQVSTELVNNIFLGCGTAIDMLAGGSGYHTRFNTLFWNNGTNFTIYTPPGQGDLFVDPRLDLVAMPPEPLAGSPCIDAGTLTGAPALDFWSQPRVGAPDIGAVEYR